MVSGSVDTGFRISVITVIYVCRHELEIYNSNKTIIAFRKKVALHVEKMPDTRLPTQILNYKPKGIRCVRKPRKR